MKQKKILLYLIANIGLAFLYHLAAELGLLTAHLQPNTSPVWPPTGIAFAVLLLFGYRFWPGIALGVMLASVFNKNPILVSLGLAVGNTLEVLVGVYLLKRFANFNNSLNRIQDVVGLAVFGALSTMISATIGVITLLLNDSSIVPVIWTVWYTWWIGDFMGALVIAPLLLVWFTHPPRRWMYRRYLEGGILLGLLTMVTGYVFANQPGSGVTHEALIYVIFPFVIYAALRLTQIGAVSAVFVVSGVAIFGTAFGTGPLARSSLNESLILLQTFMGVVSLTAMTLAAATTQRQQAEEALHQRIDDLAKLNEASQTFLGLYETQSTYETICRLAVERFGLLAAWFELANGENQDAPLIACYGISAEKIETLRLQILMLKTEGEIDPTDSSVKTILIPGENKRSLEGVYIAFHLIFAGKRIGVLKLISADQAHFTHDHVLLIKSYTNLAAVAIQNSWLFDQVKSGNEQLHALSHRLMEVQEAERLNLSRELHDESGQVMSAMMVQLGLLERDADRPELIHQHAQELKRIAGEVLTDLHNMAVKLRPASLDHLGLVTALQQYIADFSRQHNLNVQFEKVGLSRLRQSLEVEIALFRVVQESLTNVVLHAEATHVDVLLSQRGGKLVTIIEDNGVGFTPNNIAEQSHLGLFGMRERVEMLGGQLTVESSIGKGTTILVEVPNEN